MWGAKQGKDHAVSSAVNSARSHDYRRVPGSSPTRQRTEIRALVGVVQVSQFLEAGPPVTEVVVVLIVIGAPRGNGAQAARHRAVAFVIVDQHRVVRGDVGVFVCSIQALGSESQSTLLSLCACKAK